jgi:hypothetical protein
VSAIILLLLCAGSQSTDKGKRKEAREGQAAAVQGVILELPQGLRVKLNPPTSSFTSTQIK